MIKIYNSNLETNEFSELKEIKRGSWINMLNPNDEEIEFVCKKLKISEEFIR